jgi:uncharacterized protein DUF4234
VHGRRCSGVITLGIYFFVWYYKVNREARDFDSRIEVNPAVSVIAVLFGWIIIVPPFVSIYRTGERIATMQRGRDRSNVYSDRRPAAYLRFPHRLSLLPVRTEPDLGPLRQPPGGSLGAARRPRRLMSSTAGGHPSRTGVHHDLNPLAPERA